ncbi:MAG: Trm112 family protein [Candidatus Hydrothermarchaeaceae archaeon]
MPVNSELLEILACPICKADVKYRKDADFLTCRKCSIRYPADRAEGEKCPKCGGKTERIKGELLTCVKCRRWYPIIDDIPHMLPDELREDLV